MRNRLSLFFLTSSLVAGLFWAGCGKPEATSPSAGSVAPAGKFHCPMHPTYVSDRKGDCPICGMALVPIKKETLPPVAPAPVPQATSPGTNTPGATAAPAAPAGKYHCPMHPNVVSDKKGKCPDCGMALVPVEKEPAPAQPTSAPTVSAGKYHCPMHPNVVDDKKSECPLCGMDLVPIKAEATPNAAPPAVPSPQATSPGTNTPTASAGKYHCPMHPNVVSDKQGKCPDCGMALVPVEKEPAPAPASSAPAAPAPAANAASAEAAPAGRASKYHCPMHPTYVSDKKGDCPICGMALVPIKAESAPGNAAAGGVAVPGRVPITVTAEKQQLIGLRTSEVVKRELTRVVRTTATVEHDETRFARITMRFGGWIRDLKVNATGQPVEKGQPLFTVYSPELLAAETEYLLAYERFGQLKNRVEDPQFEAARRLSESARRKLTLWQLDEQEIAALEQSGRPKDELLFRSPRSGHVVSKTAVEGKSFMAGETLYEIADMDPLWLRAAVYELDLPSIREGQSARAIFPYLGDKSVETKVTFVYPHLDPGSRRAEIRLELPNPKHEFRPQMWANVDLSVSYGEVLTVPASAVIDTGTRYVAFVAKEAGRLEPREVKVGVKTDDDFEVRGGLEAGEKVVTRALFLIDSESQLKAALSGMEVGNAAP